MYPSGFGLLATNPALAAGFFFCTLCGPLNERELIFKSAVRQLWLGSRNLTYLQKSPVQVQSFNPSRLDLHANLSSSPNLNLARSRRASFCSAE